MVCICRKIPDGLKLSKDSGIISGTPVESSFETIIFEAIDENTNHIYKDLTIHIADVLQIETQSFPDSLIHENYSELIQVVGGIPPLDFPDSPVFSGKQKGSHPNPPEVRI